MSESTSLQSYLTSLPEVKTSRLPHGIIFTANKRLYQVLEAGTGGFRKARQWRHGEETDVALVADSYLTNFLTLIEWGRLLPVYPSRLDLLDRDDYISYLFTEEQTALDAAYLDAALVQSGDVYVRNHDRQPAFAITDGIHIFRIYYYDRSSGRSSLQSISAAKTIQFRLAMKGPMYWRLLPSWPKDSLWSGETIPHVPPVKS
ncbi:hypothetical protein ACFLYO_01805 [Chloroflexota bacterium]